MVDLHFCNKMGTTLYIETADHRAKHSEIIVNRLADTNSICTEYL